MRVIAGKAKSIPLKTIKGTETRPTTDRIKETLFNILQPVLFDARFLDLFSGSGGIGIEALSRGASYAVFIDNHKKAMACLKENLTFTKLAASAYTLEADALSGLKRLEGKEAPFDIIFMDPPYGSGLEFSILEYMSKSKLLKGETCIILETSLTADVSYMESLGFEIVREKRYKTNRHIFIRRILAAE